MLYRRASHSIWDGWRPPAVTRGWMLQAEESAGVEPFEGGVWHPYRRRWGTDRKHLPDEDVAAAGGWASAEAMNRSYAQAETATTNAVVNFDPRKESRRATG